VDRVAWLVDGLRSGGPAVASAVLFLGFGAAAAWLMGLRCALLVVVAALPTGIGLLVLTSHWIGVFGFQVSVVTSAVVALVVAAAIGGTRRLWERRSVEVPWHAESPDRLVWAGAAIGAAVALAVWLGGIGGFAIPPQAHDDIWHGYVVERLTHMPAITASSAVPLYPNSAEPMVYYQYGLHLAGALVHEVTGIGVADILNGAWTVHVGLLFPFGIAAAAWRLFPDRPWVAFWSGFLSSGVSIFPYVTNGIFPYTVALAMAPGLLALTLAFLDERVWAPSVVLALAGLGTFVTHPVGALAAAILIGLATIEHLVRRSRVPDLRRALVRLAGVATIAVVVSLPWLLVTRGVGLPGSGPTPSVAGTPTAAWMLMGLASPWTPAQPMLAVLTVVGVVATVVTRHGLGLAVGFLAFGALTVGVLAGETIPSNLAGPWHAGWHRLVAVVGLMVPLLAGLGVATLVGIVGRLAARLEASRASRAHALAAVVIALPAAVTTAYDAARAQSIVRTAWHASGLVTGQDVELFRDLAGQMGPADTVLNSPSDGSSWMYPLYEVTPVLPYSGGPNFHLPELYRGEGIYGSPAVSCQALLDTRATHALVKFIRPYDPAGDYDSAPFVARYPDLFAEIARSDSGVGYRIDRDALLQCANA
jgi:hypothetical protein